MSPKEKLFEILKSSDIYWFNSAVNISLKGKYVYVENPKVASSTIKSRLHYNEMLEIRNLRVGPHPEITNSPLVKPYQLPHDALCDILFGSDFFKFTFVRNPFDRLLSAYLDKIVGQAPEKGQIDAYWMKQGGPRKDSYSFSEFLEAVSNIPDAARDRHWRSQTRLTMRPYIKYSYVGRLEQLKRDLQKIQNMSSIDFSDVTEFSPHKTGASALRTKYYDDSLSTMVVACYEDDFRNFVYPRGIPKISVP